MAKVEQTLANLAEGESEAKCICKTMTVVFPDDAEEFEAEMNRTCPAHGFRRLGTIVRVRFVDADGTEPENAKLDQLLETYEARLSPTKRRSSRLRQVALKLKHDPQEP
jgi:hypothetical protein